MVYKVIGLISGGLSNGLDIIYTHIQETGGKWSFEIINTHSFSYTEDWQSKLRDVESLKAVDYLSLHAAHGHYIGQRVNEFIENYSLHHKVHLISSHGHSVFHMPAVKMSARLGDGGAIAAVTGLPVVSDLSAIDIALGGAGAPLESIAEKLSLQESVNGLVQYKDALIIALMGVLRWREEYNLLSAVTGATRNSIGGALWLGVDA